MVGKYNRKMTGYIINIGVQGRGNKDIKYNVSQRQESKRVRVINFSHMNFEEHSNTRDKTVQGDETRGRTRRSMESVIQTYHYFNVI
jgi:hypothetical protein